MNDQEKNIIKELSIGLTECISGFREALDGRLQTIEDNAKNHDCREGKIIVGSIALFAAHLVLIKPLIEQLDVKPEFLKYIDELKEAANQILRIHRMPDEYFDTDNES